MNRPSILLTILSTFLLSSLLYGQNTLMTIGDKKVSLEEFERIYNKNNSDLAGNQQSPVEYMELFINFKLKVLEAENRGMDTTQKFINEFNGYKNQLAKPYLTDEESREKMIREAYERSRLDVDASHILISLSSRSSPADTLSKYNKALEIRQRILDGEDFADVARASSDDPSARTNGGRLGYFTVFDMMYTFESAVYNMKDGEISMPVRTTYGYHIVKRHGSRPAIGKLKVAHIYLATPPNMPANERNAIEKKMHALADSIKKGEDFGTLAMRHSDDRNSAENGGELPWFGSRRMIPEFENAAIALDKSGDVSPPFQSNFGWHIVKLIDRQQVGSYEEMRPDLETKAFKNDRQRVEMGLFYDKLESRYNYERNDDAFSRLYSLIDSSYLAAEWNPGEDYLNSEEVLFSLSDTAITLGIFLTSLYENQKEIGGVVIPNLVDLRYKQFKEEFLMNYEKSKLPERYPEYRHILQEYHDGILLFEIMDQEVWSKAVQDTTGLEAFYERNKYDYMWDERISAVVVSCDSGVDVSKVYKKASKIASGKWDLAKLNNKFCDSDTINCIEMKELIVEQGANESVDEIGTAPGTGSIYSEDGRQHFIVIKEMIEPQPKALNETRGRVTSDYQDFLEAEWIAELREKYPVNVNETLLNTVE